MLRSRESRLHGSRKQETKITFYARARTLSWGTRICSLSSFSLGLKHYFECTARVHLRRVMWSARPVTCRSVLSASFLCS